MADQKKDLTGIAEYAKALEKSGHAMPIPEGSVMEEQPIEKIDVFSSLDDYAKSNPAPESGADGQADSQGVSEADAQGGYGTTDFPTTPNESNGGSHNAQSASDGLALEPPSEFATSSNFAPSNDAAPPNDFAEAAPDLLEAPGSHENSAEALHDITPSQAPPLEVTAPGAPSSRQAPLEFTPPPPQNEPGASGLTAGSKLPPPITPELPLSPPPRPPDPIQPMERVRMFSEQVNISKPVVPAAFPFSLLIEGPLAPEERARLLDLLSRENVGVREVDLEPQFAGDRVLIPRISEYAGVILAQALRSANAKIRLAPSDQIFATADTRDTEEETSHQTDEEQGDSHSEPGHPAEALQVTSDSTLPSHPKFRVIDVLTASATLKAQIVEAESSAEYQEIVEALQRELRYKAYRRGASGIIDFKVQLTQLSLPTHYRVTVLGSAITASAGSKLPQRPTGLSGVEPPSA